MIFRAGGHGRAGNNAEEQPATPKVRLHRPTASGIVSRPGQTRIYRIVARPRGTRNYTFSISLSNSGKIASGQQQDRNHRALEAEDRHLANCFNTRHWKGSEHGICAYWNERYYQHVIWRELMSSFPWRPELEWELHDLAFFDNEADTSIPVAIAEIKLWGSESGLPELEPIQGDIDGFKSRTMPGVMLVLTAQLADDAEDNVGWLAEKLGVSRTDMETASFPISTEDEGEWEFAVIGLLVARQALPASAYE